MQASSFGLHLHSCNMWWIFCLRIMWTIQCTVQIQKDLNPSLDFMRRGKRDAMKRKSDMVSAKKLRSGKLTDLLLPKWNFYLLFFCFNKSRILALLCTYAQDCSMKLIPIRTDQFFGPDTSAIKKTKADQTYSTKPKVFRIYCNHIYNSKLCT